ncbi:hypothetical protein CEXT_723751 [Caerostris extrusa]|uniref:Uncharacterized protein n=1 Tax=Caerostris extrusa TaxID=172846 RepID=A0AAV4M467_CAEEX|nr:hypothetical protein CEXT_723751 [Caerostris extrusa]
MLQSVGLLREIDCCCYQRCKISVGFPCTLLASGGRKGWSEFVPSCKCWPFPFKGCCRVSVCCEKSIAVATRDVKSASVSHAHFFASGGRKGMELNLSPHANVGRSLLKDVAECRFVARNRLLLLPEM